MTRTSSRPEIVFAIVGAVLIAGVIVSVVVGLSGRHGAGVSTVADSIPAATALPTESEPPAEDTPAPTATATSAVDPADVSAVLDQYRTAYDDEDTSELGLVLADTITRSSDGDETDGIDDVLAAYQRQFDMLDTPTYTLSAVDISPEDGGATVSASYSITSSNADEATGTIGFHLVETDSGPLIDAIAAQPD
jgi:hypothetical protein